MILIGKRKEMEPNNEKVIEFIEFTQAETAQDLLSFFKDIEDEIYKACGLPYNLLGRRNDRNR